MHYYVITLICDIFYMQLDLAENETKSKLCKLKKLFRKQQRNNKINKGIKKFQFLENLSQKKNDKKFWYNMKKFNSNTKSNTINISMSLLKSHFKKFLMKLN